MRKVFVYGTLKSSGCNGSLMVKNGGKLLGVHTISPSRYALLDLGWYPGVVAKEKYGVVTPVTGEVWDMPDDAIDRLDGYEGYPLLYRKEEVDTKWGEALIYVYNDKRESIPSDDLCRTGIWPEGV